MEVTIANKNNANKYWTYGEDALLAARFSKYLSTALRNRRADYLSQLKKNKEWEIPYEDLSDAEKESAQESSTAEDEIEALLFWYSGRAKLTFKCREFAATPSRKR